MILKLMLSILLLGGCGLVLVSPAKKIFMKQLTLALTSTVFVLSLFLWVGFDQSTSKFQYLVFNYWLPVANINPLFGIDGISLFFILLTTLIFPLCILFSWYSIQIHLKFYLICFLIMEYILILVFSCLDIFFFYIFFEVVLIPMFLVIGIWGSRERKVRAAYLFFLYTLLGSLIMLIGILYVYRFAGSTNYLILLYTNFTEHDQKWLWLVFFASFAVKVPMFPFHIWLPEAHAEAPTAGSVILAGILLKLGSYGFLRFSLGLFPLASIYYTPFLFCLSLFGVIYTSLSALRQTDFKRLIAYTSVAHMNLVIVGLFTNNVIGVEAALLQSLSHGFVSSALFFLIGVLYDRFDTRLICNFTGIVYTMPIFVIILFFFTLANLSLPGTSSFIGEFLLLVSIFEVSASSCFLAAISMVLAAAYSLWVFNRVAFGNTKLVGVDLTLREFIVFLPLILGTILMGLYPDIFLKFMHASVYRFVNGG